MGYEVQDLQPDRMQPFFGHAWDTRVALVWFALFSVPLLAAVTVSAVASGLTVAELGEVLLTDVRHLLGFVLDEQPAATEVGWPAWRDVTSVVIVLAMAWTPLNAAQQARGYQILLSHMHDAGAVRLRSRRDANAVNAVVAEVNVRFGRLRARRVPVFMVCLGVSTLLYSRLADAYGVENGAHWWLFDTVALIPVYIGVSAFGLYTATMQNFCAGIVLRAVARIEPLVIIGADVLNADKRWGWKPVGVVLGGAYRGVSVHLFALIVLSLTIPHDDAWWWLNIVAVAASWATGPIWVYLPIKRTKTWIDAFRARELALLDDPKRGHGGYSLAMSSRFDRINSIPSVPFLRGWSFVAATGAALVNAPAVFAMIGATVEFLNGAAINA